MAQCVAQKEGITLAMLKAMKGLGCRAFNANNTITEKILDEWLDVPENQEALERESHGIKGKIDFETWRKLRIANDLKEKKLVQRSDVCATIERLHRRIFPMLETKLTKEYPTAVAPTPEDAPRCRIMGQNLLDAIMVEWRSFADEWK